MRFAKKVTWTAIGLIMLLFLPLLFQGSLTVNQVMKNLVIDDKENNHTMVMNVYEMKRCHLVATDWLFNIYLGCFFMFSFILPLCGACVLYSLMLCRLFCCNQGKYLPGSRLLHKRVGYNATTVSLRCISITAFYMACFLPYWLSTITPVLLNSLYGYNPLSQFSREEMFVYLMYVVHSLPYLNCCLNWIFYGLLNSQLTQARRLTRQSERSRQTTRRELEYEMRTGTIVSRRKEHSLNGLTEDSNGSDKTRRCLLTSTTSDNVRIHRYAVAPIRP